MTYLRLLFFSLFLAASFCEEARAESAAKSAVVDTASFLINNLYAHADSMGCEDSFRADVYMCYDIITYRRNSLMRWIPGMFRFQRGLNTYEGEEHFLLQNRSREGRDIRLIAFHASSPRLKPFAQRLKHYQTLNIYSPCLFSDRLLSPLHRRNSSYYHYTYLGTTSDHCYRIAFRGRFSNTQLVSGRVDIKPQNGCVKRFSFSFYYDMLRVSMKGEMGKSGKAASYPTALRAMIDFRLLGNHFNASYVSHLKYDFTPLYKPSVDAYDLTPLYRLRVDTTGVIADTTHFSDYCATQGINRQTMRKRTPIAIFKKNNDEGTHRPLLRKVEQWLDSPIGHSKMEWGELLFDRYTRTYRNFSMTLPPLLAPEMFQWSGSKGLQLHTKFAFHYKQHNSDMSWHCIPRFSFSTRRRQFEWRLPVEWHLLPQWNGICELTGGGGRRVYSYGACKQVEQAVGIHVRPYRDNYLNTSLHVSPCVGLQLGIGTSIHRRGKVGRHSQPLIEGDRGVIRTFAPHMQLSWTPRQYYYRKGKRKKPLYSAWPTFSFIYEHGWPLGEAHSAYDKLEGSIQYRMSLYALRHLYLNISGGRYRHQKDYHFIDYTYFNNDNLLPFWDDALSGRFYILSRLRYNRSPYYIKMATTYESPMLLFSRIPHLSSFIQKERIYANIVRLQQTPFYAEMGYGLSTHVADVSAFVSLEPHRTSGVGVRFAFRLFDQW